MKLHHAAREQWFLVALLATVAVVLLDGSGTMASLGRQLGELGGAKGCIFGMFVISGLSLNGKRLREGVSDLPVIVVSLLLIFVVSPLLAFALSRWPLDEGVRIGLFLIAIMPTTLSSGVVMTGLAGGNTASAIVITVVASWLGIVTIPFSLEALMGVGGTFAQTSFDKTALALRLGVLVLLPLALGMAVRMALIAGKKRVPRLGALSQWLVLTVIGIATARSSETLMHDPMTLAHAAALALAFHLLLLSGSYGAAKALGIGVGRREAVWFMGAQKTLPIALLLQTALFPQYGNALVYCVAHHIIHLGMDSYLANLARKAHRLAST